MNVGANSKRTPPPLNFCDLYAASGWATNKSKSEKWMGSALIAAKMFGEYPNGNTLFLNSYHENKDTNEKQLNLLKKSVKDLEDCPHVYEKTIFESKKIDEATNIAIQKLKSSYPSVWLLDPYGPTQLPWKVVENISKNVGSFYNRYTKNTDEKKPEIIITLLTSVLQRFSDEHPINIKIGYDMSIEDWKEKEKYYTDIWKKKGFSTPKTYVVLDIYLEKLSKLYNKPPLIVFVPGDNDQIVYTMIHCTDSKAGHYVLKNKMSKEFEKYRIYNWTTEKGLMPIKSAYQKDLFSF